MLEMFAELWLSRIEKRGARHSAACSDGLALDCLVFLGGVAAKIVLVDGPSTVNGVKRHLFPLKRLSITSLKCDIPAGAKLPTLMKVCMCVYITGAERHCS